MKINILKFVLLLIVSIITISCSQKYDDVGIFDPASPSNNWNLTIDYTTKKSIIDTCNFSNDTKLYIGSKSIDGEIIASSDFIIDFELIAADTSLDSAILVLPMHSNETEIPTSNLNTDIIDIYIVRGENGVINGSDSSWSENDRTFELLEQDTTYYRTVSIIDSSEFFNEQYHVRTVIPKDSIRSWISAKEDNNFFGLLLKLKNGYNFQPDTIGDFYSSEWTADLFRPNLEKYRTTTSFSGQDSIFGYNSYITKDASIIFRKSELPDYTTSDFEDKIKIGAVSGEGVFYRFDISDSIPETSTILTARIKLKTVSADPVFGNFTDDNSYTKELTINLIDSIRVGDKWYTDMDTLIQENSDFQLADLYSNRDNVRYNKIDEISQTSMQSDSTYFKDITFVASKWIENPGKNLGFYLHADNWDVPFGYVIFSNPELELTYLKKQD